MDNKTWNKMQGELHNAEAHVRKEVLAKFGKPSGWVGFNPEIEGALQTALASVRDQIYEKYGV